MFQRRTAIQWIPRLLLVLFAVLSLIGVSLGTQSAPAAYAASAAPAASNGLGKTPYLGWSSWSLTASHDSSYGNSWLNAAHVEAVSDAMHQKLQSHGFTYINLDAFWYQVSSGVFGVDSYGRWTPDTTRFPDLAAVGKYIHHNGQKFGLYLVPGIPKQAVDQNTPVQGTNCHAKDITVQPLTDGNHFKNTYKIDYSKPCAQAYIKSMVDQLHRWGADFLKLDGVAPGSAVPGYDTRADVEEYAKALKPFHIWLTLSSSVDINYIDTWRANANSWRIDGDVECYSACTTPALTIWSKIATRFKDAPQWAKYAGPGGWNDFDSLDVGNGSMDGITNDERQSTTTLWAISATPLYTGDDITKLDSFGLSLLTNDEVLAVDQAGRAATPVSQSSNQQVWKIKNADGSYTVALFNLDGSTATVTANWSDLGFSGSAKVRDLWSHKNLGSFNGQFSEALNAHASRLLRVMPSK